MNIFRQLTPYVIFCSDLIRLSTAYIFIFVHFALISEDKKFPATEGLISSVLQWYNLASIYLIKVNNKDTRTTPMTSFWYLYC